MSESVDATNEIRRRRGKPPINPYIIEGFEGPGPPAPTPVDPPLVDLGDEDPLPQNAVRLTTRELIGATTGTKPQLEPGLIILDSAARVGQRDVTLTDAALRRITAIVLLEMKRQVNAELKSLNPRKPRKK